MRQLTPLRGNTPFWREGRRTCAARQGGLRDTDGWEPHPLDPPLPSHTPQPGEVEALPNVSGNQALLPSPARGRGAGRRRPLSRGMGVRWERGSGGEVERGKASPPRDFDGALTELRG